MLYILADQENLIFRPWPAQPGLLNLLPQDLDREKIKAGSSCFRLYIKFSAKLNSRQFWKVFIVGHMVISCFCC